MEAGMDSERVRRRFFDVLRALLGVTLVAGMASVALADEQTIRRVLGPKLGGAQIVSIQKLSGVALYEVAVLRDGGHAIFYTDASAQYVIRGSVMDVRTGRDLTAERLRKLSAIDWSELPFQWAITMTRGSGRRKIAVLSDPNCPYCKRFEEDLARLDDITVHIFPYAIIAPQSVRQSKAVWCSKDRVKAWNDLMFRRIGPQAAPDCDTPVEKLIEYGRRLGATATPTWFLANGERHSGALPWKQAQIATAAVAEPSLPLEVRQLPRSELEGYSNAAEYDFSQRFLQGIASRDDVCFAAFEGDKLVSYCFFAVMPTDIDAYLRFHFPQRWIYVYKAFTHPAWRGRRLQQHVFLRALPGVSGWLSGLRQPAGFVTLAMTDNAPSLSAFARLGFTPFESFRVLRVRSRPRLLSPSEDEPADFYVELKAQDERT
jgi:thiol:disulfide interchange protein DsbC